MYYIETEKNLREATSLECEILDFCREIGDTFRIKGFDTRVLDENFEWLSSRVKNSRWSNFVHAFSSHTSNEDEKGVYPETPYFEAYKKLSKREQKEFMDWIHGVWDFNEEIRWKVAGCRHILLALHMAEYIGDGKLRYIH